MDLNTLAVAYNGGGGYLETLDIADDGKSLTQVKRFQFDKNSYGIYNDLIIGGARETRGLDAQVAITEGAELASRL